MSTRPTEVRAQQLNIRLPEDVHRQLKARAALEGLTMADVVLELVRAYLDGKVRIPGRDK